MNIVKNKLTNEDTAFVITTANQYVDYKTRIDNLYTVGIHNGHSSYKFTSLESATQNAIYFIKKELKNIRCDVKEVHITDVRDIIWIIIFVIILFIIFHYK